MNDNDDEIDYDEENLENIKQKLRKQLDEKKRQAEQIKNKLKLTEKKIEEKYKEADNIYSAIDHKRKELSELETQIQEKQKYMQKTEIVNTRFIDKLANLNGFSNILKSTKEIEEDSEAKEILKKHENENNIKILKSEKYKLIKHLGNLYLSLEDLFNIDGLTFDRFQHKTANLKNNQSSQNHIPENDIEDIISVFIYLRLQEENFSDCEINNKVIDLSNLQARKFSFLEYNKLFEITKRFNILEMKNKAYSCFSFGSSCCEFKPLLYKREDGSFEDFNNYVLMDINMKWWVYNLSLFDEIYKKNLEKGFILPNSKFFQINPMINDQFKLVLVHKNAVINLLYEGKIHLDFAEDSQKDTETIKNMMRTFYSNLDSEVKLSEALKKIKYNTRKNIVNNEIKEKLKKMLAEIFDERLSLREEVKSMDLISTDRLNLMNNDDKSIIFKLNDPSDLLNSQEQREIESNKKKKKPKKFGKATKAQKDEHLIEMQNFKKENLLKDELILDDMSVFENKEAKKVTYRNKKNSKANNEIILEEVKRPLVNDETMFKLRDKYPEIFEIFDGDLDKFMNYCQDLIDEMQKKNCSNLDFNKINEKERENNYEENKELNDLSNLIIENIKNDGKLVKNDKFFYSNYETDKIFYINFIMEKYFEQENLEMKRLKALEEERNKVEKKKKEKANLIFKNEETNVERGNEKFCIKITEFSLIMILFYFCYLLLNNVLIKELSIFSSKIVDIFDEKQYCIDWFKRITSANGLNNWMLDCYMVTIKAYLTTFDELEKSTKNSIYIFHSDIQINYRDFKKCQSPSDVSNTTTEKLEVYKQYFEKCLDLTTNPSYYLAKKESLYDSEVKVQFINAQDSKGSFLDYLFFLRTTLDSPYVIDINSKDAYLRFEKFLNIYREEMALDSNTEAVSEFTSGNKDTNEMKELNAFIKKAQKKSSTNTAIITGAAALNATPFERKLKKAFADSKVSQINISVFFINQDIDKFGIVVFKYEANDSNISTSIRNYATNIEYSFKQVDIQKTGNNLFYFAAIFAIMIALAVLTYLKLKYSFEFQEKLITSRRRKGQEAEGEEDQALTSAKKDEKSVKKDMQKDKADIINLEEAHENENNNVKENNSISSNNHHVGFKAISHNEMSIGNYGEKLLCKKFEKAQLEGVFSKKLWKIFNKSFFLICAWLIFILELIYTIIHIINGTFDAYFSPFLILNIKKRDAFIFFKDNIRLFKAIKTLFLFVHLIYVIFSLKKLTIIRKLFQKGLIIFYIIISIVILAISVFVNLLLGNYFEEFNSLMKTFISLIGYSLGVESTDNIDVGKVMYLKDYILYVRITVYFIRLIVINFSLIVMYVFYKKAAQAQESKEHARKEDKKEQEANKLRFEKLKKKLANNN